MNEFTLIFPWRMRNGQHGCEHLTIKALNPNKSYYFGPHSKFNRIYRFEEEWHKNWRSEFLRIRSTVAFMDATGLRPSTAWDSVFWRHEKRIYGVNSRCGQIPPGFDHTSVWTAGRNRYAVTTEPYGDSGKCEDAVAWCTKNGWNVHTFPPCIGMWSASHPTRGTRLILASPPKIGVDIEPLIPKLIAAMPSWLKEEAAA